MLSTDSRVNGVPHFDVKITDKNLDNTVRSLMSHIKKSWDITKLHHKVYDSGITNKLVGYYVVDGDLKVSTRFGEYGRSDIVLVRIYGSKTELIIDRAQELRNFQELSRCSAAPPLYCTFQNGYCYRYLEGKVLGVEDFKNPVILNLCAKYIAKLHSLRLSDEYLKQHKMESTLFSTMRKYINLIPAEYESKEKQERFLSAVPSKKDLLGEVSVIEEAVSKLEKKMITFCHNDLLCANFIFDEYEEEIHCIDYEYGCPNYAAYDIANNFNEFAGINRAVQKADVDGLYVQVNQFSLASHLFWGIWALVQAHVSQIDFDYMEYGILRFNEYFARKDKCLALNKEENETKQ
ncbi:ethanolamine kinase 1-like isoform X2 [Hydractinia symbiolongicarpus]|uniref:ethanolamine kinase 1-like isoform X2 n=1 Tax=Hydractinia symbiolongicarpus TaxID=13093 RepID=UPI00254A76F6|nr:ethanolamine kinase 1-like isoform X2 [Hydractinia symbiolongicarpus]